MGPTSFPNSFLFGYEDGDSGTILKGGSVNVLACRFISSDPLTINSSAIQSRRIELSPEPKIIKIESRSSENDRFEVGDVPKNRFFSCFY